MEKTNKYYSVIGDLVKQHKKFAGYESILDDIIDDVYSHSEVIINSVNNESVIFAYLEKVISTSIITVPKKLNFKKPQPQSTVLQEVIQKTEAQKVNVELVDKMINNASFAENDNLSEEAKSELYHNEDVMLDFEQQENAVELESDVIENESEETFAVENTLTEDADVSEELEEMVLGDADNDYEMDFVQEKEELISANESSDDLVEKISEVSVLDTNEFETGNLLENNALEQVDDLFITNEDERIYLLESDENSSNNAEKILEGDGEIVDTELSEEELSLEDGIDFDLEQADNSDASDSEVLELEEDVVDLDLDLDSNSNVPVATSENEDFETINYSIFSYNPQQTDDNLDVERIQKDIIVLATQRPELNVLEIYNLKYKQHCSVDEISNQLEMDMGSVLEALNELVAIV